MLTLNCLFLFSWLIDTVLVGAAQIPNPWTEYRDCGLKQPGYICDPDQLMTSTDRNSLNSYLRSSFQASNQII